MASGTIKNTNKKIDYFSLVTQSLTTAGTYELDVEVGRKVSDYDMIFINVGRSGVHSRGTFLIPKALFISGQKLFVSFIYGGGIKEVDVSFISDTKIGISFDSASASSGDVVYVYGLKIVEGV